MSGKHTPGPWRWNSWSTNFGEPIPEDEADWLTLEKGEGPPPAIATRDDECEMILHLAEPMENAADRRLIAAAPGLLEACRQLVDSVEGVWKDKDHGFEWGEARFREGLSLARAAIREVDG